MTKEEFITKLKVLWYDVQEKGYMLKDEHMLEKLTEMIATLERTKS